MSPIANAIAAAFRIVETPTLSMDLPRALYTAYRSDKRVYSFVRQARARSIFARHPSRGRDLNISAHLYTRNCWTCVGMERWGLKKKLKQLDRDRLRRPPAHHSLGPRRGPSECQGRARDSALSPAAAAMRARRGAPLSKAKRQRDSDLSPAAAAMRARRGAPLSKAKRQRDSDLSGSIGSAYRQRSAPPPRMRQAPAGAR